MVSDKIKQLQDKYELDLDKILDKIKKSKAKLVLLQFPDGLKPYAAEFVDLLSENLPKIQFRIWFGSCYGACDIPNTECDLIIQFGHAPWKISPITSK